MLNEESRNRRKEKKNKNSWQMKLKNSMSSGTNKHRSQSDARVVNTICPLSCNMEAKERVVVCINYSAGIRRIVHDTKV